MKRSCVVLLLLHNTEINCEDADMEHHYLQASNPIFMHFLSISEVYPPKLKTEEKRQALTLQNVDKYNQRIKDSHMIQPDGPFDLIDMHHLTQGRHLT